MDGACAMEFQGGLMNPGGVALMPGESVLRIDGIVSDHDPVASHLGNDGGCRYGEALGVAADNRLDGTSRPDPDDAVNNDVVGFYGKFSQGKFHRHHGSAMDIDAVYGLFVDNADTDVGLLEYLRVSFFASSGRELLGIVYIVLKAELS